MDENLISPERILLERNLRSRRETECFTVINRGKLWYNKLSFEQLSELKDWYEKWLNVTDTLVIPTAPIWINNKIIEEDII